jgi:RNA polymerase nonessential primary-like sigma factor
MMSTPDSVPFFPRKNGRTTRPTAQQAIADNQLIRERKRLDDIQSDLRDCLERDPSLEEWAAVAEIDEASLTDILKRSVIARNRWTEAHIGLVVAIAKKYQNQGQELSQPDLIQEGSLGLIDAVENFDASLGYQFSTYAYWWIRPAITRAISKKSRPIRIPINITEKLSKIKKAQRFLTQKLGRTPNICELAAAVEIDPDKLSWLLNLERQQPISLNVRVGEHRDTELLDLIEDDRPRATDLIDFDLLRQSLIKIMADLSEKERQVLKLLYGWDDGVPHSYAEIGRLLHLSGERIRQIAERGLQKCRKPRNREILRGYRDLAS